MIRSIARMSPVGLRENLYAPCEVPIAIASASSCVFLHEIGGLVGVGQQHLARHRALGAVAVLLVALHRLQRAEAAQLALDGDARCMRHRDDLARDVEVVVIARDRLAVRHQRAVHHHAGEAQAHRRRTHVRRLAVVLVHHDWNGRIALDRRLDQVAQEDFAGVFPRAGRGLHDHRTVGLRCRGHDRLDLLEVVDVERGQAVIVLGGVVEQLAHGNEGHGRTPGKDREFPDFTPVRAGRRRGSCAPGRHTHAAGAPKGAPERSSSGGLAERPNPREAGETASCVPGDCGGDVSPDSGTTSPATD